MAESPLLRVDTHAHVFTVDLPMVPDRRYTPTRDACLELYLGALDRHAVSCGVLVQPSFLGTDNRYLLACLRKAPGRLRGVAVVAPTTERNVLEEMGELGIKGIRVNLWGTDSIPDFSRGPWRRLLRTIHDLGWHVELHAAATALPRLLDAILPLGVRVVIDHFGRPETSEVRDCPGLAAMRDAARTRRVWVKLSAPYRLNDVDPARCVRDLLGSFGPDRLLWGSDWPWTQHEGRFQYGRTLRWLADWVTDLQDRNRILWDAPRELYGFRPDRID